MEKQARLAGYTLSLLLLGGGLWLIWLAKEGILHGHHTLRVRFPEVGTLMEDDPVKLRGVEIGRVDRIESLEGVTVATLELYRRLPMAEDTRFVNYNYSLFGARMVVVVPGRSRRLLNRDRLQEGLFSSGVTESIHQVDRLLRTVLEYQRLSDRLEHGALDSLGGDSVQSLQALLTGRIYPALEEIGRFSGELDALQAKAGARLGDLARASENMRRFGAAAGPQSDTLLFKAGAAVEELARLTTQGTLLLHGLEKILLVSADTTRTFNHLLVRRDFYDQTLQLSRHLKALLKLLKQEGLQDAIGFWPNVHMRNRKPSKP